MASQQNNNSSPFNALASILVVVLFFILIYFIFRSIYAIFSFLAPVLLIVGLILDYKTFVGFGKWIVKMLKENTVIGVIALVLTVLFYPIAAGYLFIRALMNFRMRRAAKHSQEPKEGEYIDFEEVEENGADNLDLPPMWEQEERKEKRNDYDNLFDDESSQSPR